MKHLFIINPAAGSRDRTAGYTAQIRQVCQGLDYEIQVSTAPGECRRLARQAALTGEDYRIYACGGDGTLNEVVSGAAGFDNAAVTVLSGGSGNDFVKIFSEPQAFRDLKRLLEPEEARFDLIRCNDDLCLNICSVGLDARIGTDVARYKRLPFLHGFSAYAASTVINVLRGIGEHCAVEINGERIDGELTFVCACNGQYYGGGFHPIPQANPADRMLNVLIVKKVSRLQVPGLVGKYKNGRYRELSAVARYFETDRLTIRCDKPSPINLDGELRIGKDIQISLAEEKIRFFYPRGLSWQPDNEHDRKVLI